VSAVFRVHMAIVRDGIRHAETCIAQIRAGDTPSIYRSHDLIVAIKWLRCARRNIDIAAAEAAAERANELIREARVKQLHALRGRVVKGPRAR
jgi:hypothetical protein